MIALYKQKDVLEKRIGATEEQIINEDTFDDDDDDAIEMKLENNRKRLTEVKGKIANAEASLGAAGTKTLQEFLKSPYMKKWMNAFVTILS